MATKIYVKSRTYSTGKGLLARVIVQSIGERTVHERRGEVRFRHGTGHDIDNTTTAFQNVNKETITRFDPTAEEIQTFSGDIKEELNKHPYDWLVYACSAHGYAGLVYGRDGGEVYIEKDIFTVFNLYFN